MIGLLYYHNKEKNNCIYCMKYKYYILKKCNICYKKNLCIKCMKKNDNICKKCVIEYENLYKGISKINVSNNNEESKLCKKILTMKI